ncbi:MAG: AAA family ATPase [Victivallales bacterium]|nr:AAA family ATPase [Victivallales bacterium]
MLQKILKNRILGQDHVFNALVKYIKIGEAGLSPDNEPKATFLFTGPTGTGKTETAKVLAEILNKKLLRFDMSEYKNSKKFLYDLTLKLEKNSTGIILLDEIEKGNLEIFDYFLQILSEASITYNQRGYDFSEYYIIMTSNIGSRNIMGQDNFAIARRIVERLVKSHFRPEFLGRIRRDCRICFSPLEYEVMRQIVRQKVETEIARLQVKEYSLEYDEDILPFLMNAGVNPEFGARPIVQTVQKYIASALIQADKKSGKLQMNAEQLILA